MAAKRSCVPTAVALPSEPERPATELDTKNRKVLMTSFEELTNKQDAAFNLAQMASFHSLQPGPPVYYHP